MALKPKRKCNRPGCRELTSERYCTEHEQKYRREKDQRRGSAHERGYSSSTWGKIRKVFLNDADNVLCHDCLNKNPQRLTPTQEVHHIVALRDGGTHDFNNLMGLCKSCHSIRTVKENGGFGNKKSHHDIKTGSENYPGLLRHPNGILPSAIPLTIICGPSGSGKTKYAYAHAGPNDIIIDLDEIRADITGSPWYTEDNPELLKTALQKRNYKLSQLSKESNKAAWFIVSAPSAKDRRFWKDCLKPERVIVLATPIDECKRRLLIDERRANQSEKFIALAVKWWSDYTSAPDETVITLAEQEQMYTLDTR